MSLTRHTSGESDGYQLLITRLPKQTLHSVPSDLGLYCLFILCFTYVLQLLYNCIETPPRNKKLHVAYPLIHDLPSARSRENYKKDRYVKQVEIIIVQQSSIENVQ